MLARVSRLSELVRMCNINRIVISEGKIVENFEIKKEFCAPLRDKVTERDIVTELIYSQFDRGGRSH